MTAFTDIPFDLDMDPLITTLRIRAGTRQAREFEDLVAEVREIGRPKALYQVAFIDERGENTVTLEGVTFTSRALRKNLDSIERVFPYVATCGTEMDELRPEPGDLQKKLWLHFIKLQLMATSLEYLQEQIRKRHKITKLSSMNPGSGDASVWPLEQQKGLFSIFTDVENLIGVKMTQSLIAPEMSLAGILFPTDTEFQSCQLCRRERCRFRRAPFDPELWESTMASTT